MDTSVSIKELYELIDLYKYYSVVGERTELIVTPYFHDGKWDDSKRIITIGLQGGSSRNRDTFIVENNGDFDKIVLPRIISYYTQDDKLSSWNKEEPKYPNSTIKGVSETEDGNLLYLESLDKNLFDEVIKESEKVTEKTNYKKEKLTDEQKIWDEIICYAKRRRVSEDFFLSPIFTDDEKRKLHNFVIKMSKEKSISLSNRRQSKEKNKEIIKELFKDKSKLFELGLDENLINKVLDNGITEKIADLVGAEKRIRNRVDFDNQEIQEKINFAVSELNKVDYFNLRNASAIQFSNGKFISSQPKAVQKIKEHIAESQIYSEDMKEQYGKYCDEILGYLEKKANNNRKIITTELPNYEIEFKPYSDVIVDNYEQFEETLKLFDGARVGNEKYELIIRNNKNRPQEREVRISLIGGFSRSDTFDFLFTDGKEFDEKIIEMLNRNNISSKSVELIDAVDYGMPQLAKNKEETKKDNLTIQLSKMEKEILSEAKKQDKKEHKNDDVEQLENDYEKTEVKHINTLAGFDKLKEYAKTFKISNVKKDGKLEIYYRDSEEAYVPKDEAERRNIEFAIYWLAMVGIDSVYYGEEILGLKDAFGDENKKLFDIVNEYFIDIVENNKEVDLNVLKERFEKTGIDDAFISFERLFKDKDYVDYVKQYYEKSLLEKENVANKDNVETKEEEKENIAKEALLYRENKEVMAIFNAIKDKDGEIPRKYFDYVYKMNLLTARTLPDREIDETVSYLFDIKDSIDKASLLWLDALYEEKQRREQNKEEYEVNLELPRYIKDPSIIDSFSKEEIEEIEFILHSFDEERNKGRFYLQYEKELYDKYKNIYESEKYIKCKKLYRLENVFLEIAKSKENAEKDEKENKIEPENYSKEVLAESGKVAAKNIVEESDKIELHEGSKVQAKMIQKKDEEKEIEESAKEEAKKLQEKKERFMILESASKEAARIEQENELAEIKESAEEEARTIIEKERENQDLFDVVPNKEDGEYGPELREMEDAFDASESESSIDRPTTIKVFFNRDNPKEGEVTISNGETSESETILYQKKFDVEKLINDVIPFLCCLFAEDNAVTYQQYFDVPNTNKAGLIVVGNGDKSFQVRNANKDFVEFCKDQLATEFSRSKNMENIGKSK